MLGLLDPGDRVQREFALSSRLMQTINRMLAAPDCELSYLGRDLALTTLMNLVEAAGRVDP